MPFDDSALWDMIRDMSLPDWYAENILRAVRGIRKNEVRADISQNSTDNYRRRCQLAHVILDESNTVDLEAIAAAIWPAEKPLQSEVLERGIAPFPLASGIPVPGDPTQQPTEKVMTLAPVCDGNHGGGPCLSPQCWQLPSPDEG